MVSRSVAVTVIGTSSATGGALSVWEADYTTRGKGQSPSPGRPVGYGHPWHRCRYCALHARQRSSPGTGPAAGREPAAGPGRLRPPRPAVCRRRCGSARAVGHAWQASAGRWHRRAAKRERLPARRAVMRGTGRLTSRRHHSRGVHSTRGITCSRLIEKYGTLALRRRSVVLMPPRSRNSLTGCGRNSQTTPQNRSDHRLSGECQSTGSLVVPPRQRASVYWITATVIQPPASGDSRRRRRGRRRPQSPRRSPPPPQANRHADATEANRDADGDGPANREADRDPNLTAGTTPTSGQRSERRPERQRDGNPRSTRPSRASWDSPSPRSRRAPRRRRRAVAEAMTGRIGAVREPGQHRWVKLAGQRPRRAAAAAGDGLHR